MESCKTFDDFVLRSWLLPGQNENPARSFMIFSLRSCLVILMGILLNPTRTLVLIILGSCIVVRMKGSTKSCKISFMI